MWRFSSVSSLFLLVLICLTCISSVWPIQSNDPQKCDSELGASRKNVPDAGRLFSSLLSSDEFNRLRSLDDAFIIRLAETSEIRNITLWNERQVDAFLVWSRQTDGEWLPLKSLRGDRKVFRASRSSASVRQRLLDRPPALVADELLLLPLRLITSTKSKQSSKGGLQWRLFGCVENEDLCRNFDGNGGDRLTYDLKRHGSISEAIGGFSFLLKTRASDGVILSSQGSQGDFVLVQLRNGHIEVVIDFGEGRPRILVASANVNGDEWHGVSVEYVYDDCSLYIDGMLMAMGSRPLSGYRLDLDRQILLGGALYAEPFLKFMVADNFTGQLRNLVWNGRQISAASGYPHKCQTESRRRVGNMLTFTNGNAWVEKRGRSLKQTSFVDNLAALRLMARFRTVSDGGHVWRSIAETPISDSLSSFNVSIVEGILTCQMVLDGDIFMLKSRRRVDDGLWHRFDLTLKSHLVELAVDNQPIVRLEAKFQLLAFPDGRYALGGGGFLGCIENVLIDGKEEDLHKIEKHGKTGTDDGIIWDQCPMWDRCKPNPCANGGTCQRSTKWQDYVCICPYGYSGKQCTNVDLPHNCQEYRDFHRQRVQPWVKIDLDDSGHLNALEIECGPDGSTILRHDQTDHVDVYGFVDRGSARIDYTYLGIDQRDMMDSLAVAELTRRAKECRQEMSYKCYGGASLMGRNGGHDMNPSSWWLSWMATNVYAWGDGEPDSMMCSCAVFGTCGNGGSCNCDSISGSNSEDVGNVTRKELLPIRRVFVGDTDFHHKRASVNVGSLICTGDESLDPATFLERQAYMVFPFRTNHLDSSSISGYLQLRTRECLVAILSTNRRLETEEDDDGCEYLRLHVENCRIVVLTFCGGGGFTKLVANFSRPINDDAWHSIKFTVTTTNVVLSLDNEESTKTSATHLYTAPDTTALLAWRLGATGEHGSGFTGAVRSVFLNGHSIPVSNLERLGRVHGNVQSGLVNRCATMDDNGIEDSNSWCRNGGRCEEHYHKVVCDCSATAFAGSRCQQDVSYDLIGKLTFPSDPSSLSTTTDGYEMESSEGTVDYLRLGFQTKSVRSAILRGFDRGSKTDVLALLLTDTGNLRLLYTDNYTPFTVEEDGRNFADGYFHTVEIRVDSENRSITLEVDQFRHRKLEWRFPSNVRPTLNRLDWIVGDDGLTSLFSGCLARLQIGQNFFPFKTFGAMLRAVGDGGGTQYRKSMCPAIEDNLPEEQELPFSEPSWTKGISVPRPDMSSNWIDAPRVKVRPMKQPADRSLIVGAAAAVAMCILLLMLCCLIRFCRNRPAGEYKTHEETLYLSGAMAGHDSSQQALVNAGGEMSPSPVERREWFI